MNTDVPLFPEQASEFAPRVDALYAFLLLVAVVFTALICCLILYFAVRYRRDSKADRMNPPSSQLLELSWAVVPFILTMIMFFWGATLYFEQHQPPEDADEVLVVGKQWMWKIQHPSGKQEINNLHIPVGRSIRLKMISEDVIHSFYVPAFRVKQDVLPGRYTSLWFKATKPGRYHLFCAEYCGTSHSQMGGSVFAMEPAEYAEWLNGGTTSNDPPEVAGEQLFTQLRCHTCHSSGSLARCPNLDGVFGRQVQLANGQSVIADEDYLRESILEPNAKVVVGYPGNMPTYKGQVTEQQLMQLIAYLKSKPAVDPTTESDAS